MSDTPTHRFAEGWYDDGHGALRYWDGVSWTEHVATAAPTAAPASGKRKGMPVWGWVLLATSVFLIATAVVAIGVLAVVEHRKPMIAAEAVLDTYDAAWVNADCGALKESTTDALRSDWGYDDCSVFVADATDFDEGSRDYQTTISSTVIANGQLTVRTTESYTDVDGKEYTDEVTYTLIKDGDEWRIDSIHFASDGDGGNGGVDNA